MSNPIPELAVWSERWRGMKEQMQFWLDQYDDKAEQFERQSTLVCLLASLQAFGDSQMSFFMNGLAPQPQYRLEPSAEFPWEYALRTTVNQVGYDMDVLQRAFQQRLPQMASPAMRETLDLADRLAYQALKPAIAHQLVDGDTAVVTYFQKAVNVRLAPYAPVAIVGIPYSAVTCRRDLLAIPHEVGHYVFREGRIRNGRFADSRFSAALYSQFNHQPAWCTAWIEEIFADVYGALVAGPVIALSFQELVTDSPLEEFMEDDGEHPTAVIRPEIYHSVLKRMQSSAHTLQKLKERWQSWLAQRGNPQTIELFGMDEEMTLERAASEMDNKAVALLLQDQFLGRLLPQKDNQAHKLWSSDLGVNESVDSLYTDFAAFIQGIRRGSEAAAMPKLKRHANNRLQIYLDSGEAGGTLKQQTVGATGLWIDAIKEAATKTAQQKAPVFSVPVDIWAVLLDAGGWAVEGPGGTNLHS
jgi:hypothetical protein